MENTYKSDLSESASNPFSKVAILECKKSKKLAFWTMYKHFFHLSKQAYSIFWVCAWVILQKKAWYDRDVTIWKDISKN